MTTAIDPVARGMAANALARNSSNLMNGRIAAIGDSLTYACALPDAGSGGYYTMNTTGYLPWLTALSRGKFEAEPSLIKGVNGETATQIAARYDVDIAPYYDQFDLLVIQAGPNDTYVRTPALTSFNAIRQMAEKALARGKVVVLLANMPRTYWGTGGGLLNGTQIAQAKKIAGELNQLLRNYQITRANVFFIDPWRDMVAAGDAVDGAPDSLILWDGLHVAPRGAYRWAQRFIDTIGALYPAGDRSQMQFDSWDPTDAPHGNLINNPNMNVTGAGGVVGTPNVTGNVPDGWNLQRYAGTSTAVAASNIAASSGYNAQASKGVKIAPSVAAGATWFGGLSNSVTLPDKPALANQTVYAECEIAFNNLVNVVGLQLYLYYYNGSISVGPSFFNSGADLTTMNAYLEFPNGQPLLFRTPKFQLPSSFPAGSLLQFNLTINVNGLNATPASGDFTVRNAVIRRI